MFLNMHAGAEINRIMFLLLSKQMHKITPIYLIVVRENADAVDFFLHKYSAILYRNLHSSSVQDDFPSCHPTGCNSRRHFGGGRALQIPEIYPLPYLLQSKKSDLQISEVWAQL